MGCRKTQGDQVVKTRMCLFSIAICVILTMPNAARALSVKWKDPDPSTNLYYYTTQAGANSKTFVAHVTCHDHTKHNYDITFTIGSNGGKTYGTATYTTDDDFDVDCTWTGFSAGNRYTLDLTVKETDTGAKADTDPDIIVVIPKVEIQSLTFSSDHGLLRDNNADWTDAGSVYSEPEWTSAGANNPISQTKNTKLAVTVSLKVEPTGVPYVLVGDGGENYVHFTSGADTSDANFRNVSITADANLPDQVAILSKNITWTVRCTQPHPDFTVTADTTGPHKIYVTYGTPFGSVVTEHRVEWVTEKAQTLAGREACADKLYQEVSSNTTFNGSGTTEGWPLLGGGSGDCDNLAQLLCYTVEMLGVDNAFVKLVRASSNAGAGNCLDLETRNVNGETQYLVLDFDPGPGYSWNAYEGCCNTVNSYYAMGVSPLLKRSDDYQILKGLSCQQYWVTTNVPPGNPTWTVISVHEEVLKP